MPEVFVSGGRGGPAVEGPEVDAQDGGPPGSTMVHGEGADPEQAAVVLELLAGDADGESWQERALCAETDPEAFFPEKGGSTREAKRICAQCEVRVECLEYALESDERFGIWGGLSERERRRLQRGVG